MNDSSMLPNLVEFVWIGIGWSIKFLMKKEKLTRGGKKKYLQVNPFLRQYTFLLKTYANLA